MKREQGYELFGRGYGLIEVSSMLSGKYMEVVSEAPLENLLWIINSEACVQVSCK